MNTPTIQKLAHIHEQIVSAVVKDFDEIARIILIKRGHLFSLTQFELLHAVSDLQSLSSEVASVALYSAEVLQNQASSSFELSESHVGFIRKIDALIMESPNVDHAINLLKGIHDDYKKGSIERELIIFSKEIMKAGKKTIYSQNWIKNTLKIVNQDTGVSKYSFVSDSFERFQRLKAADNAGVIYGGMRGALGGAGMGAIPSGAGVLPGAATGGLGGAAVGAYGASGLFMFGLIWDGRHHGPNDPNGPIGAQ